MLYQVIRAVYRHLPLSQGLKLGLRNRAKQFLHYPDVYSAWVKRFDTLNAQDRRAIRRHIEGFSYRPKLSVVMPVYNTPERWLRRAIESVRHQLYPDWELCIANDGSNRPHVHPVLEGYQALDPRIHVVHRLTNGHISHASNSALALATGEYVILLDHDDELTEHALYLITLEINRFPDVKLIFSDEDKIDANGRRFDPYFKPDFSYDLLLSQNMINHLGAYETALLREIGGFRAGFEGSQDHDLVLRCIERISPQHIRHIPRVLYHWRAVPGSTAQTIESKTYALDAARKAIGEHLERRQINATVAASSFIPMHHRVIYRLTTPPPRVTIMISVHNGHEALTRCVDRLRERTQYVPYDILVIDRGSEAPQTHVYLTQLEQQGEVFVLYAPDLATDSAIKNFAAQHATGEVLVFLSQALEVIRPEWLTELVANAMRFEVGAVGARLLTPDDHLQHAGMILGLGGIAGYPFRQLPRSAPGQAGRAVLQQNISAVSGTCLAVRKALYSSLGGFDEVHVPDTFNDIDLCLRLREAGYLNIYTPYAEFYYHIEQTPSQGQQAEHIKGYLQARWGEALKSDPYYNPNLTLEREDVGLAWPPRTQNPWAAQASKAGWR